MTSSPYPLQGGGDWKCFKGPSYHSVKISTSIIEAILSHYKINVKSLLKKPNKSTMTSEKPKSNLSSPQNENQEEKIEFEEPEILSEEPSTSGNSKSPEPQKLVKTGKTKSGYLSE